MREADNLSSLAALAVPLPPAPPGDVFTAEQWDVLLSICETFVPQLVRHADLEVGAVELPDYDDIVSQITPYVSDHDPTPTIEAFLSESVIALPEFKDNESWYLQVRPLFRALHTYPAS